MQDTSLGSEGRPEKRLSKVKLPPEQEGSNWGWNSPYWRNFGAAWGGMFSTVADLTRFLKMFLNGGWAERDARIDVVYPYSGEAFDTVPAATPADGTSAVEGLVEGAECREREANLRGRGKDESVRKGGEREESRRT